MRGRTMDNLKEIIYTGKINVTESDIPHSKARTEKKIELDTGYSQGG